MIAYTLSNVSCLKNIPLKLIPGGFLVSNRTHLLSYSFDSSLLFHKKFSTPLMEMHLVSTNHLVYARETSKTLNICNIFTGDEIEKLSTFEHPIVNVYCNLDKTTTFNLKSFEAYNTIVCVILASMELHVFHVRRSNDDAVKFNLAANNLMFNDKKSSEITFVNVFMMPYGGLGHINSLNFLR